MMHQDPWAAVEQRARELAGAIDEAVSSRGEEMAGARERLTERAGERWREARGEARVRAQQADDYAREHVWTATAIAAAAGVVIGALFGRRR